jgi:hypothetical protein
MKKKNKVNWLDGPTCPPNLIDPLGNCSIIGYVANSDMEMIPVVNTQQESNMQVAVNTQEDDSRDYLMSRLNHLRWKKEDELSEKFHISRKTPKNVKQAKEWLETGYFRFDDKADDQVYWRDFFRWGTEEPDKDGFNKAMETMKALKQASEDIIMVKTDEDARLKALKDFESFN